MVDDDRLRASRAPDAPASPSKTLADYMRESDTDLFLRFGPQCPGSPDWAYRDFYAMPAPLWLGLLKILGGREHVRWITPTQISKGGRRRAQIWISPQAQESWRAYLSLRQ